MRKQRLAVLVLTLAAPAIGLGSLAWVHRAENTDATYATLSTAYLTVVLVGVTAFYAWTTRQMAHLMQRDLEQRTLVELYVRLIRSEEPGPPVLAVQINNLSSVGIWVDRVEFLAGQPETMKSRPLNVHPADLVVPAFNAREVNLLPAVWNAVGGGTGPLVQARVKARVLYRAFGAWKDSDWTEANVHMHFGGLGNYGNVVYCVSVARI